MRVYIRKVEVSENPTNRCTDMIFYFSVPHKAYIEKEFNFFEFLYNKNKQNGFIDNSDIISAALLIKLKEAEKND